MNASELITYRKIEDLEEMNEVVLLQKEIWSLDVVSPLPQLLASSHHGGMIIGAFFKKRLIGFCYGFAGFKDGNHYFVSHMAAVHPEFQNAGVGYQLKLKQREWAIAYGYQKIVWTFDPLEVRNGYFNLNKLGAYSKTYYSSYYGEMPDKLNKGLPTDRLLIEWDICSNRVEKALHEQLTQKTEHQYEILIELDQDYPRIVEDKLEAQHKGYFVPVPTNIQLLKQTSFEVAKAWRYTLRKVFSDALLKGYIITGVQKVSNSVIQYYLLEKMEEHHD